MQVWGQVPPGRYLSNSKHSLKKWHFLKSETQPRLLSVNVDQVILVYQALFQVLPLVISSGPDDNLTKWVELSPFYKQGPWGSCRWRHLPRGTQGTRGRTRVNLTARL